MHKNLLQRFFICHVHVWILKSFSKQTFILAIISFLCYNGYWIAVVRIFIILRLFHACYSSGGHGGGLVVKPRVWPTCCSVTGKGRRTSSDPEDMSHHPPPPPQASCRPGSMCILRPFLFICFQHSPEGVITISRDHQWASSTYPLSAGPRSDIGIR